MLDNRNSSHLFVRYVALSLLTVVLAVGCYGVLPGFAWAGQESGSHNLTAQSLKGLGEDAEDTGSQLPAQSEEGVQPGIPEEAADAIAIADAVPADHIFTVTANDIVAYGLKGAVQPYLDQIRTQGDGSYYRVVLPDGDWSFGRGGSAFNVYSNTIIDCRGQGGQVVIRPSQTSGLLLRSGRADDAANQTIDSPGGYDDYENIMILGGTWTGRSSGGSLIAGSNIRIGHASNVSIINTTMRDNCDAHHVELGGVKGALISNCLFEGYSGEESIEAVQLDVVHRDVDNFTGFYPYDDLATVDTVVKHCTFNNVRRGVGSHHIVLGSHYDNIVIEDNYFYNLPDRAVSAEYFTNSSIKNNVMVDVNSGILVLSMLPAIPEDWVDTDDDVEIEPGEQRGQSYLPNGVYTGSPETLDANIDISDNYILLNGVNDPWHTELKFGIRLGGWNVTEAHAPYTEWVTTNAQYESEKITKSLPVGVYRLSNVSVHDNEIFVDGNGNQSNVNEGVRLTNVQNVSLDNNIISFDGRDKANGGSRGIYASVSDCTTVCDNTVTGLNHANAMGIQFIHGCTVKRIDGNEVTAPRGYGIYLNETTVQTVNENSIHHGLNGILLINNAHCTAEISSNALNGTDPEAGFGINVAGATANAIHNNMIIGKNTHGIYVHTTDAGQADVSAITANTVQNVSSDGICVAYCATGADISNNTVMSPGANGVRVNNASAASISHNTVTNYKNNGILIIANAAVSNAVLGNVLTGAAGAVAGVNVCGSTAKAVSSNTVTGSNTNGILVHARDGVGSNVTTMFQNSVTAAQADGIRVKESTVTKIASNTVSTAGGHGISAYSSSSVGEVSGNNLSNLGADGIHVAESTVASIISNTVKNYARNGVLLIDGSKCSTALGSNTITGNVTTGFAINVAGSTANTINANTISGSNAHGIFVHANSGSAAKANTIQGNNIENVTNDGIYVSETAAGSDIASNTVTSPGGCGVRVKASTVNAIRQNTVTGYKESGVFVHSGSNVADAISANTLTGAASAVCGVNVCGSTVKAVSANTVTGGNADGILVYAYNGVGGNVTTISENSVTGARTNGIRVRESVVANVSSNTVATAGENGVSVYSSSVGGVTGNDLSNLGADGIYVGRSTIANITSNTVKNYARNGVLLIDGSKCTTALGSNKITGNVATGFGINVAGSTAKTINANTISGSNTHGIFVHANSGSAAKANTIQGNKIKNVDCDGIYVSDTAAGSDIASNTVTSPGGCGVRVKASTVAMIRRNTVMGYKESGVLVVGNSNVTDTIYMNTLTGSASAVSGVNVCGSTAKVISTNTVIGGNADGILVHPYNGVGSNVTNVYKNSVTGARTNGIRVRESVVTKVASNTVATADEHGISVHSSTVGSIMDNNLSALGADGIYVGVSTVANITNNTVKNYVRNGVLLIDGAKCTNTLGSNKLTGKVKTGVGINVAGATVKTIDKNTVNGKNAFCIHVHKNGSRAATVTTMSANKVYYASNSGIFVNEATVKTMSNNIATSSVNFGINIGAKTIVSNSTGNSLVTNGKSNKPRIAQGGAALFSPKTTLTVKAGKTFKMPSYLYQSPDKTKVTYKTSNAKIATVSAAGVVKGVKKGTATITVTKGKAILTIKLTVS